MHMDFPLLIKCTAIKLMSSFMHLLLTKLVSLFKMENLDWGDKESA